MIKEKIEFKLPQFDNKRIVQYGNEDASIDVELAKVAESMYDTIMQGETRKAKILTEDMFKSYILTLQCMNSWPEDQEYFLGVHSSKWQVPNLFSNLIQPATIKVQLDDDFPNLIDTDIRFMSDDDMKRLTVLSYEDFNSVSAIIESIIRKPIESTSMAALRSSKVLRDVLDNLVEDGKVHYQYHEDKPLYFIRSGLQMWSTVRFTMSVGTYIISRFDSKWKALKRGRILEEANK